MSRIPLPLLGAMNNLRGPALPATSPDRIAEIQSQQRGAGGGNSLRNLDFGGNLDRTAFNRANDGLLNSDGSAFLGSGDSRPSYNQPSYTPFNSFAYMDAAQDRARDALQSIPGQFWNVNSANQQAELLIKALNARVQEAALPAQYRAQADMYASDNNLRGVQTNADAARYQSDNTLAGTRSTADANVQATGLTANSALAQAQAQAAAQQAVAQQNAQAAIQRQMVESNALLEQTRLQQAAAQQINSTRTNAMLQALGGFGNVARDIFGGLGGSLGGLLGGTPAQGGSGSGSSFTAPTFEDPYKKYAANTQLIAQLRGA